VGLQWRGGELTVVVDFKRSTEIVAKGEIKREIGGEERAKRLRE
jgi:hypothetical protein